MDLGEQMGDVHVLLPQTLPWAQGLEIDQTGYLSSGSSQGYEHGTGVTYSGISAVTQGGAWAFWWDRRLNQGGDMRDREMGCLTALPSTTTAAYLHLKE